ncbi:MAG: Sulfur carrier protein adenylyltransferase [bacterium]|nr:Sulfur carrier protein adenylyltransferase [bacterium]
MTTPFGMTEEQIERYARHIILPEMGGVGQRKLLASSALIVGAGGLGSPAALYLVAAGLGKLGLVDMDVVDLSNLQRQVLHHTPDVGHPKLDSARRKLTAMNPDLELVTHETRLMSHNALEFLADYDVIIDGTDNFPARYLINDACVMLGKPLIHAGIFRFEGQILVIKPGEGPCYRCLYPDPPPAGLVPSCQEAGILGSVAGVLGVLQATEAIKVLCGIGSPLVGRLLIYDALNADFRKVRIPRDPACAICGSNPTITELEDLELAPCQLP